MGLAIVGGLRSSVVGTSGSGETALAAIVREVFERGSPDCGVCGGEVEVSPMLSKNIVLVIETVDELVVDWFSECAEKLAWVARYVSNTH
jgi:ABC-type transport system involved in cytochrome bd biosynthesis fused ATPase/permease subunit